MTNYRVQLKTWRGNPGEVPDVHIFEGPTPADAMLQAGAWMYQGPDHPGRKWFWCIETLKGTRLVEGNVSHRWQVDDRGYLLLHARSAWDQVTIGFPIEKANSLAEEC